MQEYYNSNNEEDEYIELFRKKKRRQILVSILAVINVVYMGIMSTYFTPNPTGEKFFFGFMVCLLIFSFYNWRCPKCKTYFGRSLNIKYCPYCRTKLKED